MADQNLYEKKYIILWKNYYDGQSFWVDEHWHFPLLETASRKLQELIEEDNREYSSVRQYRIVERETYTRITEQDVDPIWDEEE